MWSVNPACIVLSLGPEARFLKILGVILDVTQCYLNGLTSTNSRKFF